MSEGRKAEYTYGLSHSSWWEDSISITLLVPCPSIIATAACLLCFVYHIILLVSLCFVYHIILLCNNICLSTLFAMPCSTFVSFFSNFLVICYLSQGPFRKHLSKAWVHFCLSRLNFWEIHWVLTILIYRLP